MRAIALSILTIFVGGAIETVRAADLDYDYLRGGEYDPAPVATIDWSGVYVGGHGGYTSASLGFGSTAQPIVANYLRQTVLETELNASTLLSSTANRRVNGISFGAFAGYNLQFDQIVLGVELDYTHFGIGGGVYDEIARSMTTKDGWYNQVALTSYGRTKIEDYATFRGRAGYAFGDFLPFVTGGVAIGSAQISDRVTVQGGGYDQTTYRANQAIVDGSRPAFVNYYGYKTFNQNDPGSAVLSEPYVYNRTKTKIVAGFSAGAGIEYAITSNFLLRAEYQYALFDAFDGHKVNLNTVRGGAAVKF